MESIANPENGAQMERTSPATASAMQQTKSNTESCGSFLGLKLAIHSFMNLEELTI